MKTMIMAAAMAVAAQSAVAATLSLELDGFAAGNKVLNAQFNIDDAGNEAPGWTLAGYNALAPAGFGYTGDTVTQLTGAEKTAARGLSLSGPALVTFTYLGEEAGFSNSFAIVSGGETLFANNGVTPFGASVTRVFDGGFLDFSYVTGGAGGGSVANNGGVVGASGLNIAYSALFNGGTSVLTFFGDFTGDSDNDDLAVRIDVAPIPLPAAAWMLLGGLGGLALVRRKRA